MKKTSILIVDDEPDNFDVIEAFLSGQDYQLHYADSGSEAIASLNILQPDLILLDVMMPGTDGIELCRRIKAMPQWKSVPIVMVTALAGKQTLARCLDVGADDFISKPFNRLELIARIGSMLRIHDQYQQLNALNTELETLVQQKTAQLQALIFEDALTDLPTRYHLLQLLSKALECKTSNVAIAYLDCDQFKLVNGAFGYLVGNQLLQAIAARLKSLLRPGDVLARVGEDEFCFLLHNIPDEKILNFWIQEVLQAFDTTFEVDNYQIFMSVCIGVALSNNTYDQPETLLQAADTAMYKAKLRGKGCYQIFDHQMYVATLLRITLENDLQQALEHHEFVAYYQPIFSLVTNNLVGFEALVRWQHPQRGMLSAGEFIPCMEETGQVVRVGILVLRQACQQLQAWHQLGWSELTMSVNLSVRQFASSTLLTDIDQIIAETGINPACLKLEITESVIMQNAEAAIQLTEKLRSRQIQICIDDFGTGYSSLGYLHRFPIDILKIDRSFVSQIEPGNRHYQVVQTIITLSNQLGLTVVAEGIETQEQLQYLQELGSEFGQGYLFSRPIPAEMIEKIFLKDCDKRRFNVSFES
ncbi:EAL domain-containing response regulator [Gloeocapsa sp. PCC 73106]|uniref:two-component system response regulator n=1 Tax=Gloeocapsa sp. PCC 73106 TaxID=102232 RepID=UPI0002ABECED|nr:EAL domain-containing response regulator [Gloeocapsa sp. PCC 73106]ELR99856.1 diguanylate cyclase (GGDEF) domain-containing protein [Gloeocapsa sp. PCC 73106]